MTIGQLLTARPPSSRSSRSRTRPTRRRPRPRSPTAARRRCTGRSRWARSCSSRTGCRRSPPTRASSSGTCATATPISAGTFEDAADGDRAARRHDGARRRHRRHGRAAGRLAQRRADHRPIVVIPTRPDAADRSGSAGSLEGMSDERGSSTSPCGAQPSCSTADSRPRIPPRSRASRTRRLTRCSPGCGRIRRAKSSIVWSRSPTSTASTTSPSCGRARPSRSLPGVLWRLYLLQLMIHDDPRPPPALRAGRAETLVGRRGRRRRTEPGGSGRAGRAHRHDPPRAVRGRLRRRARPRRGVLPGAGAGASHLADDYEPTEPERASALTTRALRLADYASDLSACAALWRRDSLT